MRHHIISYKKTTLKKKKSIKDYYSYVGDFYFKKYVGDLRLMRNKKNNN